MRYTAISASDQVELYELKQEPKLSIRAIAKMMGSHPSRLSCELKRNQFKKGSYLPDIANPRALERCFEAKTAFTKI